MFVIVVLKMPLLVFVSHFTDESIESIVKHDATFICQLGYFSLCVAS